MGNNMENKRHRSGLKEQMLVIVNQDWTRAYVASIDTMKTDDLRIHYTAKCKLENAVIVSTAKNKDKLSQCMNELATLSEDYILGESPAGTFLIAGINWCPN